MAELAKQGQNPKHGLAKRGLAKHGQNPTHGLAKQGQSTEYVAGLAVQRACLENM